LSVALTARKQVFLPRFMPRTNSYVACHVKFPDTDLALGQFGVREPSESCAQFPLNRLDLVLVPGIAFDLHGRRLGRGKGFYDQLLAAVRGKTCGVAFDEQIVNEIPVEPHDVLLNCILTPSRWIQL
jgi:5-formyltetrahydrofolate cyclo-ligase